MQGMNSTSLEVHELISVLKPKVQSCDESLSEQSVGNALYGLNGMSSESVEVQELITVLVPKILRCKEIVQPMAVSNALYGMHDLMSMSELTAVLRFLLHNVLNYALVPSDLKVLSRKDMICLGQGIILSLPAMKDSSCLSHGLSHDEYLKWNEINVMLGNELNMRYNDTPPGDRTVAEKRIFNATIEALKESGVLISHTEYLHNYFECDVVLRIPNVQGDSLIINIEVDGIHHIRQKKRKFCMLRDTYLKSKGIVIERITDTMMDEMKDEELKEWVLQKVSNSLLLSIENQL
jgi:hypothetical protein